MVRRSDSLCSDSTYWQRCYCYHNIQRYCAIQLPFKFYCSIRPRCTYVHTYASMPLLDGRPKLCLTKSPVRLACTLGVSLSATRWTSFTLSNCAPDRGKLTRCDSKFGFWHWQLLPIGCLEVSMIRGVLTNILNHRFHSRASPNSLD